MVIPTDNIFGGGGMAVVALGVMGLAEVGRGVENNEVAFTEGVMPSLW